MYQEITFQEQIKVPPQLLGGDVEQSVRDSVVNEYVGKINPDLGVVLAVKEVSEVGDGEIRPEDPGVYYPVTTSVLTFKPQLHEVVIGEVSEITEFGAFIDLGPLEGLCHVSQVMDDYVSYNDEQHVLAGEDENRLLKEGDTVKARITAVSIREDGSHKINLTMRQAGLGKPEWIADDAAEDEEDDQ